MYKLRHRLVLLLVVWSCRDAVCQEPGKSQSPLAVYTNLEHLLGEESDGQLYTTLRLPAVPMAGPVTVDTAPKVATKIFGLQGDLGFDIAPKSAFLIGDSNFAVHFSMSHKGVPITESSGKMLLVKKDGTPLLVRDRKLPLNLPQDIQPRVQAEQAVAAARSHAAAIWKQLKRKGDLPSLEVTIPTAEIWIDRQGTGHLCWTLLFRATDVRVPFSYRIWIAASGDPRVLALDDQIYSLHKGRVVGTVWQASPFDAPAPQTALSGINVTSINQGHLTSTNNEGQFEIPGDGADLIISALFGSNCVILDDAGAELRREAISTQDQEVKFDFHSKAEFELAQTSAFYWVNQGNEFVRSKVGQRLNFVPTRVNIDDTGNAFWDGFALNFFRAGDGFPNTAYSSIVLHEYGDAVDGRLGGIRSRSYSEGFGDALSILILNDPVVGKDFFGKGKNLRDASKQVVKWTDGDVAEGKGEAHRVGEVYAGFVWELLQKLPRATVAKMVLDVAEMNPRDIPDAIHLSLIADDTDGDLTNGTPNAGVIKAAAESRKIPLPKELP